MKIKESYIEWYSGYIRFNRFELNWNVADWALPFSIQIYKRTVFLRFLFISIIFKI
jgi:hypothetical protein